MAYTELYIVQGGNDVNAGGNANTTADATSTNGNWDSTTGIFIAASGTPFASTNVGDMASVYNDGATLAVFIAKVTTVTSSTQITIDITNKWGTAPTTSGTARSVKINGAWNSEAAPINLGTLAVPYDIHVNWKTATYANTTTSRTFNNVGAAGARLHYRGYNTTIGDCDSDPTLSRPTVTFTTGGCTFSGVTQTFSSINWSSSRTGGAPFTMSNQITMKRCQFIATGVNAASVAMTIGTGGSIFFDCYFEATSTATRVISASVQTELTDCTIKGGGHGVDMTAAATIDLCSCRFQSNGNHGVNMNTAGTRFHINECTFSSPTNDGIRYSAAGAPGNSSYVRKCVFDSCGGWRVNSSAATQFIEIDQCYGAHDGLGTYTGLGGVPAWDDLTDSASKVTSTSNLTLLSSAAGYGKQHYVETASLYSTYPDIGAVQHQDAGGGGGTTILAGAGIGLVAGL